MAKRKSFSINRSLSKGLEDTINAAHEFSGELFVEVIPLAKLELDPENPRELHLEFEDARNGINPEDRDFSRKRNELDSLVSLSKSIKNHGLINPVVVYKHLNNYRLVAGERRTLASVLAGNNSIQARILPSKPTVLNRFILQWAENIEREDLTLGERLSNIQSIVDAYASEQGKNKARVTAAEMSDLIGISNSQSSQYKVVMQASDELLSAIKQNQIQNLDKAALIAKAPYHQQMSLISLCGQGATLKELKAALVDEVSVHAVTPAASSAPFRVAIKNEKVVRLILNSIMTDEKYIHLRDEFDYDPGLDGKRLSRVFNKLVKKLEETV